MNFGTKQTYISELRFGRELQLGGALAEANGLSEMEYGQFTIDAVSKLSEIANKDIEGLTLLYTTRHHCIENTFNWASWHHTLNALSNLNVPMHIHEVMSSYFKDRLFLYETDFRPTRSKPIVVECHLQWDL